MKCPYCNQKAVWCENKEIYGKNYGKSYMVWLCRPCDAYVATHRNTRRSMGTMANKPLRELRIKCHDKIDPYWKQGAIGRKDLYALLDQWWGKEFHIGQLNEEDCRKVLEKLNIKRMTELLKE